MNDQIFNLMYYGKMGFTYGDLYNMPVYLRYYFYRKLADIRKKENAEAEEEARKARKGK